MSPAPNARNSTEQFRPFVGGWVRTTHDALLLFRAAKEGIIPSMPRRLSDLEKVQFIRSGAIFVFEEKRSGIKRWTDSREWSPSRILHNFLIYRELDPNRPDRTSKGTCHASSVSQANAKAGQMRRASTDRDENEELMRELLGSLREHDDFQKNGLMKKTITITFDANTPHQRAHHIISYYTPEDVLEGRLLPIHKLAIFQGMEPSHEWLDPTHFRFPPKIEYDEYGYRRYIGEADDEPVPTVPPSRSLANMSALAKARTVTVSNDSQRTPRTNNGRYVPYVRPILTSHDSSASISSVVSASTDVTAASASTDSIDATATRTPTHMPSLSPSSTSSSLSVTSPHEYTAAAHTMPFAYYGAPQMSYAAYHAEAATTGPELSSLPAVDHSAAPRPSPYYSTAFWPSGMGAEENKASMHHLQMGYDQQAMYGAHPYHPGYAYAQYDPYYPQPPHTASSAGGDETVTGEEATA